MNEKACMAKSTCAHTTQSAHGFTHSSMCVTHRYTSKKVHLDGTIKATLDKKTTWTKYKDTVYEEIYIMYANVCTHN